MELGSWQIVTAGGGNGAESFVLHGLPAHEVNIIGSGIVAGVMVAVGVGKMRALHAQLLGTLIHQLHKGVNTAAHRLGQGVACLVRGGQQDTVEQIQYAELLPNPEVCGRAPLPDPLIKIAGKRYHLVERDLPLVHRLQRQQSGHNLGDAGRITLFMGGLLIENCTCASIH